MKKAFIIFCLTLFVTGLATAQLSRNGTMFAAVRNLDLKASTGFFARTTATLNYGDRVTVLQVSGRFAEVQSAANPSFRGWTPSANLTARQVVAQTSGAATGREVAMAARGFNQEVERTYRDQNQNLNYADVDRVEAIRINENDLRRFIEEGRLATGDN